MNSGAAAPPLPPYDALLVDLDGVVFRGVTPITDAPRAIDAARRRGQRVVFVTNNATRRAGEVAALLCGMGVDASVKDVVTSADAAAAVLSRLVPAGSAVLVVGTSALVEAVRDQGFQAVRVATERPAAVVQGLMPDATYGLLAEAALAIRGGATWVSTNLDATMPTERGELPGSGAIAAFLRTATGGIEPVVVGKPMPALMVEAAARVSATRPLVIGDRLDTDIAAAKAAGFASLLVLSGAEQRHALLSAPPGLRPDLIASSLAAAVADQEEPWCADVHRTWSALDAGVDVDVAAVVPLLPGATAASEAAAGP